MCILSSQGWKPSTVASLPPWCHQHTVSPSFTSVLVRPAINPASPASIWLDPFSYPCPNIGFFNEWNAVPSRCHRSHTDTTYHLCLVCKIPLWIGAQSVSPAAALWKITNCMSTLCHQTLRASCTIQRQLKAAQIGEESASSSLMQSRKCALKNTIMFQNTRSQNRGTFKRAGENTAILSDTVSSICLLDHIMNLIHPCLASQSRHLKLKTRHGLKSFVLITFYSFTYLFFYKASFCLSDFKDRQVFNLYFHSENPKEN